jgi:signal peptidase II
MTLSSPGGAAPRMPRDEAGDKVPAVQEPVPPDEEPESGPEAVTRSRSKVGVLAAVAVLAVGLDALSKALVVANLTPGQPVHILGNIFEFVLLRNSGAAFSFGTGYTVVFTLLAVVVIIVVIRMATRLRSTGYAVAFGLLLGGAAGNLADRIFRAPGVFRGDVVDWIGVVPRYYPVFNLADSCICIAAVLFVILSLRGVRMDGSSASRGDDPPRPPRLRGEDPPDTPLPRGTRTNRGPLGRPADQAREDPGSDQ